MPTVNGSFPLARAAAALLALCLAACSAQIGDRGDAGADRANPLPDGGVSHPPDASSPAPDGMNPPPPPPPDGSAPPPPPDGMTPPPPPPPGASACPTVPVAAGDPALPREFVDTREVAPTGRTISVAAGGDLQAALNSASPGDVIELAAGATFTGNFTLPVKSGDGWVLVRSSGTLPSPGTRVTPTMATQFAHVVTPNALPVIATAARAHHYRFVGIDFTAAAGQDVNDLIVLGSGSATTLDELAHHVIIDRCYVHAAAVGGKRGIQLNAAYVGVVDSYVSGFRRAGQDTQAILGWNGPGPFRIVNNYLEGAAENVMFGGADATIPGVIPTDIEFCHNHVRKPRAWRQGDPTFDGTAWTVKNLFELKVGRRVLVAGNVFEQVWPMAQTGFALVIKTANQDGRETWATTEDVTIAFNVVRRAAGGAAISNGEGSGPTMGTHRVRLYNNAFTEIGVGDWAGNGRLYQALGVPDVRFDHNTGFGVTQVIMFDGGPNTGFVFVNNLCGHTMYGVFGSGQGEGTSALATYAPMARFSNNALVGAPMSRYPAGNFFPADDTAVGFVGLAAGDLHLVPSSPLHNAGTDMRDVGADIDALTMATMGATSP